jgi:hypothetical protein
MNWKAKVEREKIDLEIRLNELKLYLGTDEGKGLGAMQKQLLETQSQAMNRYLATLKIRLNLWKK